jgi:hypothetical protein
MTTDPDDNPEETGTTQWPRERREMHAAWHGIPVWMVTASGDCPECRA